MGSWFQTLSTSPTLLQLPSCYQPIPFNHYAEVSDANFPVLFINLLQMFGGQGGTVYPEEHEPHLRGTGGRLRRGHRVMRQSSVRLKAEAPSAVRQGRCGKKCSCEQIQVRLVVNKMKRNYPGQWRRVESKFG